MKDTTRQRLAKLTRYLQHHPDGVTTQEIATHFNVSRQTAHKDIDRLEQEDGVPVIKLPGPRYTIDEDYNRPFQLTTTERWLLYLPLRRMARIGQHRSRAVRNLLYEISRLITNEDMAAHLAPPSQEDASFADTVFSTLVDCWQKGKRAQITYRRLNTSHTKTHNIAPYWFEPAPWSDAVYMVCDSRQTNNKVMTMTLKLDRIESVTPLNESFEMPDVTEMLEWVERAWGVWTGYGVRVVLRFSYRVAERVRETRWHPDEHLTIEEDGSLLWEATVSEVQEMLPWIRGWGAEVEVIAPDDMREQIIAEANAVLRLYGQNNNNQRRFF